MSDRDWQFPRPQRLRFNLHSLVSSLAAALDLVGQEGGSRFSEHSQRVSYIALTLGEELGHKPFRRNTLYICALLHDAGIASDRMRRNVLRADWQETDSHSVAGWRLLGESPILERVARVVRSHHDSWQGPNTSGLEGESIPLFSRIISLADRVAIMISNARYVLHQRDWILEHVTRLAGVKFDPMLVECLRRAAARESFWLDVVSGGLRERIASQFPLRSRSCSLEDLRSLAGVFARVIDMKSPFTLEHSHGVARVAAELARRAGAPAWAQDLMEIAGLLHDVGKLSIPDRILEKPAPLTGAEFEVMKRHVYETHNVLGRIPGLEEVSKWASFHHERLDGSGYPFHVTGDKLSLGARIMAVSDVFQALNQNRPYRSAFSREEMLKRLDRLVKAGAIDGAVAALLREDYDHFQGLALLTGPSS